MQFLHLWPFGNQHSENDNLVGSHGMSHLETTASIYETSTRVVVIVMYVKETVVFYAKALYLITVINGEQEHTELNCS